MKRLVTLATMVMMVTLLSMTTTAFAQDAKLTSQVEELLGGVEYVPTKAEWQKLGPDAAKVLRQIAADDKALATKRARATAALSYFDDAETKTALVGLLNGNKTPSIVKRKALGSLTTFGNDGLEAIKPSVDNKDKRMRESAIKALGKIKTPESKAVLEQRMKVETAKYLKEEIAKSIKTIDKK